jgi:drug/metabolite transporter (DMT)-like permease
MLEIFNYWQVNLVLTIIFSVIFNQYYRKVAKDSKDIVSTFVLITLILCATFLIFVPFFEFKIATNSVVYGWLLFSIFFYVINDRTKASGFQNLDVAVVSVLTQLSKVFLIFYGVFLFAEKMTTQHIIGAILILAGSVMVVYKKGSWKISKYIWFLVVGAFAFATAMSIDIKISEEFSLPIYLFLVFFLPMIIIYIIEKKNFKLLLNDFNVNQKRRKYFFITGVSFALASMFYLLALRQGQVSIVAPISSLTVLLNVFAGYIFLKERDDLGKRVLAAVIAIIGVILLV